MDKFQLITDYVFAAIFASIGIVAIITAVIGDTAHQLMFVPPIALMLGLLISEIKNLHKNQ